jgi:hypothetical protein
MTDRVAGHRCVGFGAREGICRERALHPTPEEAGGPVGRPYWCDECEAARVRHISERLDAMVKGFPKQR